MRPSPRRDQQDLTAAPINTVSLAPAPTGQDQYAQDCNLRVGDRSLLRKYSLCGRIADKVIPEEPSPAVDAAQPIDRAELHRWARSELRQGRRAVRLHRRLERRYRKAVLKARG